MRFVDIKTVDQQALLFVHRARDLVVRQRTQVANMIRSVLREFGHIVATGIEALTRFVKRQLEEDQVEIPPLAKGVLGTLCSQFLGLNERIQGYMAVIEQHALVDRRCRKLTQIPGVGPVTASAVVATIGDARQFKTRRDLAAWLGLTPLNRSSGGKDRLGKISKKGDSYLRKLLVVGMTSRAVLARSHPERVDLWTANILAQKPFRLATVAMANKTARVMWAMLTKNQDYKLPAV